MQKIFFAALLMGLFSSGLAAQNDTIHYLFKPKKVKTIGIWLTSEAAYGQSAGSFTGFQSGSASLVFNKRFGVGVAAGGILNESFTPASVNSSLGLRAEYGGLKLSYTFRPDAAVHVGLNLVAGGGFAQLDSLKRTVSTENLGEHGHQNGFGERNGSGQKDFFVAQPGLFLEANVIRNVKLFAAADYRIGSKIGTVSTTGPTVPSDALNGFSIGGGVKIGFNASTEHKKRAPRAERRHIFRRNKK